MVRMSVGSSEQDPTNLFRSDSAVHECTPLQVGSRTHTHSMNVYIPEQSFSPVNR
jgi:hypothetical protein